MTSGIRRFRDLPLLSSWRASIEPLYLMFQFPPTLEDLLVEDAPTFRVPGFPAP